MAAARLSTETIFLREFARTYVSEIALDERARAGCRQAGMGLADVLYVLKNGRVNQTIKEDLDGATWVVDGHTCHGDYLRIWIQVWCQEYRVRVVRVEKVHGVSDAK